MSLLLKIAVKSVRKMRMRKRTKMKKMLASPATVEKPTVMLRSAIKEAPSQPAVLLVKSRSIWLPRMTLLHIRMSLQVRLWIEETQMWQQVLLKTISTNLVHRKRKC